MTSSQQSQRRQELFSLLGDLPDRARPIHVEKISEERREKYVLEKLVLDLNGIEPVPAYFIRPLDAKGRLPTMLYNHAHGGVYSIGKEELISGRRMLIAPYAEELTRLGYAALCIDHWAFCERSQRTESAIFKRMLWSGQVMWGMMAFDSLRAVDYLMSRPDVDAARLATMGFSMGSTMSWWVAALEPRIKVCIDVCALSDFQAILDSGHYDNHSFYYYVPSLLKHFTASQINALTAPRAHLSIAGDLDGFTPPVGSEKIDAELRRVYSEMGAPAAWKLSRYPVGHDETPEMRAEILAFLKQWL